MGKIRNKDNNPMGGLKITAYNGEPTTPLGEDTTDADGLFKIEFDKELKEIPNVDVTLAPRKILHVRLAEILKTRYSSEKVEHILEKLKVCKELEYQIKIVDVILDPDAKDIYHEQIKTMLSNVRNVIETEYYSSLKHLHRDVLGKGILEWLENFVEGYRERLENFYYYSDLAQHVIDFYIDQNQAETAYGYDGSQVPGYPKREAHIEVIIWPRKFKGE